MTINLKCQNYINLIVNSTERLLFICDVILVRTNLTVKFCESSKFELSELFEVLMRNISLMIILYHLRNFVEYFFDYKFFFEFVYVKFIRPLSFTITFANNILSLEFINDIRQDK
jgi:hypothetical protein